MARIMALLLAASCLAGFPGAAPRAQPATVPQCPIPEHLALHDLNLPRARAGLAREARLAILTLGGAATMGSAAGDPAATYPAQIEARLTAMLPGAEIRVLNRASPPRAANALLPNLTGVIAENGVRLVIWASGAREAARGTDIDDYITDLQTGIELMQRAGADVILMEPQYAPSIARIVNTEPYREALHGTAAAQDVAVLRRYELMMHWNDAGVMELDVQGGAERQKMARHLFACIAAALAPAIAQAVR